MGVRPEKIILSKNPPSPENQKHNYLMGTVWDIAYLGNLSIFHIKLNDGQKVTVARTNRLRDEELEITWEDKVHLTWTPHASIVLLN